ncbi:ATP-binding cassette domain-containing protein [Kribbella sp. DT2]|uniref:ATP-binding cassette domain-containing protein n=1 Tax=Kribbella sp. DT2 TaxID=3393427 RepID=UPI003CEE71D0
MTGLLGPSGCGKTTLIRAIVGLQAKVTGDVQVLGLPAGAPKLRGRIGYVTQEPSVYGDLTVTENLRFFAAVLGVPADDVARVIDAVDLGSHAGMRVDLLADDTPDALLAAAGTADIEQAFLTLIDRKQVLDEDRRRLDRCAPRRVAFDLVRPER